MSSASPFSAAPAALGYMYQVRLALLLALRRLPEGREFMLSLETLDDVVFETNGLPNDLIQAKHHCNRAASLTNACPDLWKSLRVWFEGHADGSISSDACLHLITTATAAAGSAASLLTHVSRDVDAAQAQLEATASTSVSHSNKEAYSAFLRPSRTDRKAVLERVWIVDASSNIVNLDFELTKETYHATDKAHQSAFVQYLEGWWLRRVISQLLNLSADRILSAEIEAEMSDLRQQFKQGALPISDDLRQYDLDEATAEKHADSPFVHQLHLAKVNAHRIAAAIRDYYRAFEQRSRWTRDDLIIGDLDAYERRLKEEWELTFRRVQDDLGQVTTEELKINAARTVLSWAETALIPIRPAVTEPFVTRGSLHMLADGLEIGWHPEFRDRLASLLNLSGERA